MTAERLYFVSVARKGLNHVGNGFVYRSVWATGYEDLVFTSHQAALTYAVNHKAQYEGPAT